MISPFAYKPYFWSENGIKKTLCQDLVTDMALGFLEVFYILMVMVQEADVEPELFRFLVEQEMTDA